MKQETARFLFCRGGAEKRYSIPNKNKEIIMKSLVIAEKPSVARDIARVLHCTKKLSGAMEGSGYVVTWALGHLVTLADPEVYDK